LLLAAPVLLAVGMFLLVGGVSAQSDAFVNVTSTAEGTASGLFGVLFICIWCGTIILAFGLTAIWILSIIDILKRDNWKNENDKVVWLVLVLLVNIVSIYYYFFYRKQLDAQSPQTT